MPAFSISAAVSTAITPGEDFACLDIDRDNARGRMRRTHKRRIKHARLRRIGDIAAASGDQRFVFDARKRRMMDVMT